ncbi:MAG: hypothetical protein OEZ54_03000 [Gemmatimonadota bacterium]|nr:hypothetical protein [Gemmatimonadota bacterium]
MQVLFLRFLAPVSACVNAYVEPVMLSAPNDVEPELTLMLVVNPELVKNRGGSRCHGRPR